MTENTCDEIMAATRELSDALAFVPTSMPLGRAVRAIDPTRYAWHNYERFMRLAAGGRRRVLIVGMNPGPYGMSQTGVPFGDVDTARRLLLADSADDEWPALEHEGAVLWRREGLKLRRVEESGRRLWSALELCVGGGPGERASLERVLGVACIVNYCPLFFVGCDGRNKTPADLPKRDERMQRIEAACDRHMRRVVDALMPSTILTLGEYADVSVIRALTESIGKSRQFRLAQPVAVAIDPSCRVPMLGVDQLVKIVRLPHPSPQRYHSAGEWMTEALPVLSPLFEGGA